MIKTLSIIPNSSLYHELVCAALAGVASNPSFSGHSTRERAQQALDIATHALEGIVEVDGGERDFRRQKEPQKKYGVRKYGVDDFKHRAPGRPAILDEIRPHLQGFLASWGADEVLSIRKSAEKLCEFAKLLGIELSNRVSTDLIWQMREEAKLSIKESEGKIQVSL